MSRAGGSRVVVYSNDGRRPIPLNRCRPVVREHAADLIRFATVLVGPGDAHDIAVEAFLRAAPVADGETVGIRDGAATSLQSNPPQLQARGTDTLLTDWSPLQSPLHRPARRVALSDDAPEEDGEHRTPLVPSWRRSVTQQFLRSCRRIGRHSRGSEPRARRGVLSARTRDRQGRHRRSRRSRGGC